MTRKTDRGLTFSGWGLIGDQQDGILVQTADGIGIDVTGYNAGDYWDGKKGFLGPDPYGVVPVYRDKKGSIFPARAKEYPYNA